jgi:hypothetical protein
MLRLASEMKGSHYHQPSGHKVFPMRLQVGG